MKAVWKPRCADCGWCRPAPSIGRGPDYICLRVGRKVSRVDRSPCGHFIAVGEALGLRERRRRKREAI